MRNEKSLDEAIKEIDSYICFLASGMIQAPPKIVNFNSRDSIIKFLENYKNRDDCQVVSGARFLFQKNCTIRTEQLESEISNAKKTTIIWGVTGLMDVSDHERLSQFLRNEMLEIPASQHGVILLTYQCDFSLQSCNDPRKKEHIIFVKGQRDLPKRVIAINNINGINVEALVTPLNYLPEVLEEDHGDENVFVLEDSRKFRWIEDKNRITNAYEFLLFKNPSDELRNIGWNFLSPDQWIILLNLVKDEDLKTVLFNKFGTVSSNLLERLDESENAWLILFYLKGWLKKSNEDLYLRKVLDRLERAEDLEVFKKKIADTILCFNFKDSNFEELVRQRRSLFRLLDLNGDEILLEEYVRKTTEKKLDAIYYLNDQSISERKQLVKCLKDPCLEQKDKKAILDRYGDLKSYLNNYAYTSNSDYQFINDYFNNYRIYKASGKNKSKVIDEARRFAEEKVIFDQFFESRAAVLNQVLNKAGKKPIIIFVDALGAEFSGLFDELCSEYNLNAEIQTATCNLPSFTATNKEFIEQIKKRCPEAEFYPDENGIKDLDRLIHKASEKDKEDYLVEELNTIREIVKIIKQKLEDVCFTSAIIISDHGSSFPARWIRDKDIIGDFRGDHGGRCAPANGKCPLEAVDRDAWINDRKIRYFCIRAYDHFAPGRKIGVELHGGALPEEMMIPIILIKKGRKVQFKLIDKEIKRPIGNRPAVIGLFCANRITQELKGRILETQEIVTAETQDYQNFSFSFFNLKRKGDYTLVITGGEEIKQKLEFKVIARTKTKELF